MKLLICIYFIVIFSGPCVRAKSFNFGNFFLGNSKKALNSEPAVPLAEPQKNLFDSKSLDYSVETESDVFNSSSDDFNDFDYQNASSDSLEVSGRNEPNNPPDSSDNTTTAAAVAAAEIQNNETHSSEKHETTESASSSTATSNQTTLPPEVPPIANVSSESPIANPDEQEEVVLGTTTGATDVLMTKTFFQKSIDWVEDTYTLSILIPIAAGILFATAIIVTVAVCRCVRRCCRRRSFKRKPLPDSVKNLRPSDRARLLGDTSDEEF